MTAVHDMSVRQGNTFRRRFRFRGFDGNPLDFSGSTVSLSIDGDRIRKSTREGTLTMVSAISGEVEVLLTAGDTRDLAVGVLPYEVERQILDERTGQWDEATILTGSIVVERGLNDER